MGRVAGGLILAAALLALDAPSAAGQATAVAGHVVDADAGLPLPGAVVTVLDTLGATIAAATTDGQGRFRVPAPAAGEYLLYVRLDQYLSHSAVVRVPEEDGAAEEVRVEMPLVSVAAARVMREVIDREAAFRIPLEELCQEPLRPWEAGVLVGVARSRQGLEPIPHAVVRVEPIQGDAGADPPPPADRRTPSVDGRVATDTGAFWFCNVPVGRTRVVARAAGFAPDTSYAAIRAGTISWYDALLRGIGGRPAGP